MRYIILFFCTMTMLIPTYGQEDNGTKVMECEYCNSVNISMHVKDGKFVMMFDLAPDILKMGSVSWHKILKKVREAENYKDVKKNIRFLPFEMPENTPYRPNVHTEIIKNWRENTTICLVIYKCIFVMSHSVAQDMLWQFRGNAGAEHVTIEVVLNTPQPAQNFYCFFPLVKVGTKQDGSEETQETDPKEFLFVKVGRKEGSSLVAQAYGESSILDQVEVVIDGWVPTPGRVNFQAKEPLIINLPKASSSMGDYDVELRPGISTVNN